MYIHKAYLSILLVRVDILQSKSACQSYPFRPTNPYNVHSILYGTKQIGCIGGIYGTLVYVHFILWHIEDCKDILYGIRLVTAALHIPHSCDVPAAASFFSSQENVKFLLWATPILIGFPTQYRKVLPLQLFLVIFLHRLTSQIK